MLAIASTTSARFAVAEYMEEIQQEREAQQRLFNECEQRMYELFWQLEAELHNTVEDMGFSKWLEKEHRLYA